MAPHCLLWFVLLLTCGLVLVYSPFTQAGFSGSVSMSIASTAITTNVPRSAQLDTALICGILGALAAAAALPALVSDSLSERQRVSRASFALGLFSTICAIVGMVFIVAGTQSQEGTFLVSFFAAVAAGVAVWRALIGAAD